MGAEKIIIISFLILAFIWGAAMGSFLDCMATRFVRNEKITGRSHCDFCGKILNFRDLIPIVSYLVSKGRCRYCGNSIGKRCLVTELIQAFAFALIFLVYGLSWDTLKYMIMLSALLPAALIDIDIMEIPDRFWIIIALEWVVFLPAVDDFSLKTILINFCAGLILGLLFLIIALVMEKLLKREALGGGDIKLFFALGLHFGIMKSVFLVLVTCVVGITLIVIKKDSGKEVPLAPSIGVAALITILAGNQVTNAYATLIGIKVI